MGIKQTVAHILPKKMKDAMAVSFCHTQNIRARKQAENEPAGTLQHGIRMYAYLGGNFGVGMLGGMVAAGCKAAQVPLSIGTIQETLHGTEKTRWDGYISDNEAMDTNLMVFNAEGTQQIIYRIGAGKLAHKKNIGLWSWELPDFPDRWKNCFEPYNEIWTISEYCRQSISQKSPVPVYTVPLCIEVHPDEAVTRKTYGIPEDAFVFLCMYDVLSIQARKNPRGAVEAFVKAFDASDRDHFLVIKINHGDQNKQEIDQLREYVKGHSNILLINESMTLGQVHGLVQICDAFVSLHRAEGFGIPMAEAMSLKKPVIVTGWSGNMDFTNEENACLCRYELRRIGDMAAGPYDEDQFWAEPDTDDAANWMRKLAQDRSFYEKLACSGCETIKRMYSAEACGKFIQERMSHQA